MDMFSCSKHKILCLQVEPCDDIRGNDTADVLNDVNNVITDSDVSAVKQVNNSSSDSFVIYVAFTY